ncbi:hypothetical protein [Nevskia soli]|uniref:hypothetical protein n=1 Tax=Nevskia soli TaxID=418856 RepID=UPI0012F72449|nr:hypothetical protein [Nevskia soli]
MDPRTIVSHLEKPLAEYVPAVVSVWDIVLAGLQWPGEYWAGLAVSWLEQGAPLDSSVADELDKLSSNASLSQGLRHRAFGLARRFNAQQPFKEFDVVRVVALNGKRNYDGTEGSKRHPQIGDVGTVVHVLKNEQKESPAAFTVEAVAPNGDTLWVADFAKNELKREQQSEATASERATFSVVDHFEIAGRGVVVLGSILSGTFKAGMHAVGAEGYAPLKISGVEFLRGSNPNASIGIVFREHAGLQALRGQFPSGNILVGEEA